MNKLLLVLVVLPFMSCMTWKQAEPEAVALAHYVYADVVEYSDDASIFDTEYYDGTVHMLPIYNTLISNPVLIFIHEQTHNYQWNVLKRLDGKRNYQPNFAFLYSNMQLETEQEACLVEAFIAFTKLGYEDHRGYAKKDLPAMVKYMEKWMLFTFSK